MLRPCPSIEVYEECSEEENNPPVEPKLSQPTLFSLKQGMELLTDDQLERLMGVVAKDMRFKYDLFVKLREQYKLVESLKTIRNENIILLNDHCFTCGQAGTAGWLRSAIRRRPATLIGCSSDKCSYKICLDCAKTCAFQTPLCVYCLEEKKLEYKKQEWSILLWPLSQECFGWSKYNHVSETSSFAAANWTVRAKLELHLTHLLDGSGISVDSAQVDFQVSDIILESSRQKLVVALMDYSTSGHFAHIDHAVDEVKQVLRRRSNCIQFCSTAASSSNHLPSLSYFHLLSNAIISMLLRSLSQHISCATNTSNLRFRRPRRAVLPCLSELDLCTSTAIDARGIMSPRPVHPNHKHFPVSSLRTSRLSLSSHLEVVKESPDDIPTHYFELPETGLCVIPANEESLPPTPGPLSSPAVLPIEDESPSANGRHVSIAMEQLIVEAFAGQMVTVRCAIRNTGGEQELADNKAPLQLIWYNRRRQIPTISKTGRIRVSSSKTSSKLEIFDCDAYKDSGDIVCVAVGDCVLGGVQAATTRLIVHDDDIAGEEPMFVQPLSISNPRSVSSNPPHSKPVVEGDTLLLKCRVSGLPQPYLKFFASVGKNVMEAVDASHKISFIDELWTLRVEDLKLHHYLPVNHLPTTLTYTAVAMNRIGKCASSIQLTLVQDTHYDVEQQTSL